MENANNQTYQIVILSLFVFTSKAGYFFKNGLSFQIE